TREQNRNISSSSSFHRCRSVNGSVLDIGNSYPVQITQQNHHQVAGVERLKSEFQGMTLSPPLMREEAVRNAFAGPLNKKSFERPTAARWNGAGLFAHLMRARSEDRTKSEAHPI